jgi:hypothetical protein
MNLSSDMPSRLSERSRIAAGGHCRSGVDDVALDNKQTKPAALRRGARLLYDDGKREPTQ